MMDYMLTHFTKIKPKYLRYKCCHLALVMLESVQQRPGSGVPVSSYGSHTHLSNHVWSSAFIMFHGNIITSNEKLKPLECDWNGFVFIFWASMVSILIQSTGHTGVVGKHCPFSFCASVNRLLWSDSWCASADLVSGLFIVMEGQD